MKRIGIILSIQLFSILIIAQNLIPNGSFEEYSCVPSGNDQLIVFDALGTFSFIRLAPDSNRCRVRYLLDTLHPEILSPVDGKMYLMESQGTILGIGQWEALTRGAIYGTLTETLQAGALYKLTYYTALSPWSHWASNWQIFCFDNHEPGHSIYRDEDGNITHFGFCSGIFPLAPGMHTQPDKILDNRTWVKIENCYRAQGWEQYFTLVTMVVKDEQGSVLFEHESEAQKYRVTPANPINAVFDRRIGEYVTNPGVFNLISNNTYLSYYFDDISLVPIENVNADSYTLLLCDDAVQPVFIDSALIVDDPFLHLQNAQYIWEDGEQILYRSFDRPGTYRMELWHTCNTWVYEFHVEEKACAERLYMPNAFSPNGDGINDVFRPEGSLFELISLQIYDRFGSMLYEGVGSDAAWDGTARGLSVQDGTYIYLIHYQTESGETKYKSGEVVVRR